LGFNITSDVSIECEFNYGIEGGDIDFGIGSGETDMWTLAGYGVYRHFFDNAFIKAKAGFLREDISVEYEFWGISFDDSETDSGFSSGIGCGYRFVDGLGIEAEYTVIEEDVDFLSVGITYSF
jgi:opacity protein-like surface antigen